MARYINRVPFEELIEHLNKKEPCKNCYHRAACDAWVRNATTLYDDYIYSVENCPYHKPTADVVEVKHGYWIYDYSAGKLGGTDAPLCEKCSVCGEYTVDEENFCPNCGAKMDAEKALAERSKE